MYDVAISYQNEKLRSAQKIYDYLTAERLSVFFAPESQQEIVSEKLHRKLYDLYKNQSFLKLLLISPQYLKSEWTQLEQRMALDSTREDNSRLILVNYTRRSLPGKLSEFAYINGMEKTEDQIAAFVSERVKSLHRQPDSKPHAQTRRQAAQYTINNNHGLIIGGNSTIGDINFGK